MNTENEFSSTTRVVNDFSVSTHHQYADGEAETVASVYGPSGLLATGLWSGHQDPRVVAGEQVDEWLRNGAQPDSSIGCGWANHQVGEIEC